MKYEIYNTIKSNEDLSIFEFERIGRKGCVKKRIEFTPTETPDLINLAFGNIDENEQIDDYSVSDNGDRNKILATCAYAVESYLNRYPNRWIYF